MDNETYARIDALEDKVEELEKKLAERTSKLDTLLEVLTSHITSVLHRD